MGKIQEMEKELGQIQARKNNKEKRDSTRDSISTNILEELARINEDSDASFKEERLSVFVNFILEKEYLHKYIDLNIRKTKSLRR